MYLPEEVPDKINAGIGSNLTEAFANIHFPVIKNKMSVLLSGRRSWQELWENNPAYSSYTQKVFQSERKVENESQHKIRRMNQTYCNTLILCELRRIGQARV